MSCAVACSLLAASKSRRGWMGLVVHPVVLALDRASRTVADSYLLPRPLGRTFKHRGLVFDGVGTIHYCLNYKLGGVPTDDTKMVWVEAGLGRRSIGRTLPPSN
ncbi:hypothetical protein Salat_0175300 [Sesamum alatum]|uniref:Uncharacterized protein n=1 Tax=Sesamum alatum TaxID=300844 RepID=A0AAE2CXV3_9LAMI|nr:hypothetical protein Salat_0175300 [Sesamum alatum]